MRGGLDVCGISVFNRIRETNEQTYFTFSPNASFQVTADTSLVVEPPDLFYRQVKTAIFKNNCTELNRDVKSDAMNSGQFE